MKLGFIALSLLAASSVWAEPPPLPSALPGAFFDDTHQRLVEAMHIRLEEVFEIEKRFNGNITTTEGPFVEIGKVDFILSQAARFPRRFLHEHDHDFVYTAVRGQSTPELESNLDAIVHYVRLANAARWYNYRARRSLPLVGERTGLSTVNAIAKRVYDFREKQLERIENGQLRPSQALSRANLGDLGRPELLAELETAYQAGQDQFVMQRNSVVFLLLVFEIGLSFLIAVIFLRRTKPFIVVGRAEA